MPQLQGMYGRYLIFNIRLYLGYLFNFRLRLIKQLISTKRPLLPHWTLTKSSRSRLLAEVRPVLYIAT